MENLWEMEIIQHNNLQNCTIIKLRPFYIRAHTYPQRIVVVVRRNFSSNLNGRDVCVCELVAMIADSANFQFNQQNIALCLLWITAILRKLFFSYL